MNSTATKFIRNFSYTLTSNLFAMLVSTLIVLIIPKLIGVEEYGYWQLYLFYSTYVGFLHFGWNDGIYLRYGGKKYHELDKVLFFSQFYMLVIVQVVIAAIIFGISTLFFVDANRVFILQMTALCMLIVNVRYMLLYILQGTNRIKEYAQVTFMDRMLYSLLILAFVLVGVREFQLLVIADLIGKMISCSYAMFCCKDIVFRKITSFYFNIRETIDNINVGVKLMFANIASMLIIGAVRFGIERSWDVSTFGKVSLALSVSNLMMIFINAVGIIIFPILRRTDEKKLPGIYETIRTMLMVILLGLLILYYPLKLLLSIWLPQYADSLMYMALVFPMCVYEGKMALLINTYLKALRKEKLMLQINTNSLALSVLFSFVASTALRDLDLAVVSIVILLAFRCVLAEISLSKIMSISVYKDITLELAMTAIFIVAGWFLDSWVVVGVYLVAYVMYLFVKRQDIITTYKNVKLLMGA